MKDAFIFETEAEDSYPQGEYSYEDFEGDYEAEDYEGEGYETEGYEAEDYEAEDFEDYEYDPEMEDEFRGRIRGGIGMRPRAFSPVRRIAPFRQARFAPMRFRPPGMNRFRRPYRWRPGFRRPRFGFGGGIQPGTEPFPSDGVGSQMQPSNIVMLLQRLLNRTMGANLPVDGVMSVETRSALRSFQSQADTPPTPNSPPSPPVGGTDAAPPQAEYDELEFLESEFDEYGY
jgi:hypothetical protein